MTFDLFCWEKAKVYEWYGEYISILVLLYFWVCKSNAKWRDNFYNYCVAILNFLVKVLDWGEDGVATAAETAALRASFKQEVAVWHKLDHPNVTKVNTRSLQSHLFYRLLFDTWKSWWKMWLLQIAFYCFIEIFIFLLSTCLVFCSSFLFRRGYELISWFCIGIL